MNAHCQPRPATTCPLPITDHDGLRRALADANLPTLLMVYTTYAQDRTYLDSFAPYLTGIYTAEAPSDVPDEMAQGLRDRLFALLTPLAFNTAPWLHPDLIGTSQLLRADPTPKQAHPKVMSFLSGAGSA